MNIDLSDVKDNVWLRAFGIVLRYAAVGLVAVFATLLALWLVFNGWKLVLATEDGALGATFVTIIAVCLLTFFTVLTASELHYKDSRLKHEHKYFHGPRPEMPDGVTYAGRKIGKQDDCKYCKKGVPTNES